MSEEELENKMKQILDDYAPILNVTPETALLEKKPLQTKEKKKEKEPGNTESNQTLKTPSEKSQDELEPIINTHSEEEKTPAPKAPSSTQST